MTTHRPDGHVFGNSLNKRFVDVAQQLRLRIRNGQYGAGERMPAIDRLAEEFGVAIITVRHALAVLEGDGLVVRRQGLGTFVQDFAASAASLRLPLDADWSEIRSFWKASKTKILSQGFVDECPTFDGPEHPVDTRFFRMRRVHSSARKPYTVADIYIEESIFRRAPERFRKEIALHVLADLMAGEHLDAQEVIRIDSAGGELAKLLQIAVGAPIVIAHRVVKHSDGRIAYVGTPIYPGEIVQLKRSFVV